MTTTPGPHSGTVTLGHYLGTRLAQLGAHHVFGLPGDFALTLLDEMLTADDLTWAGSTNELNAAYAADGYARAGRGLGAIVTTYGVGELSAVNGIAGAYAEDVPLVHIGGMPSRDTMAARTAIHHSFLDGDFERFARILAEVTIAAVVLDDCSPEAVVDETLLAALLHRKPVHIGVPLDIAGLHVPAERLATPLAPPREDRDQREVFARAVSQRLAHAHSAVVLAGPRLHRLGAEEALARLAELPGVLVATQTGAKGALDESHPASLGTYIGAVTSSAATRELVDSADPLILVGTVVSDFTTGFFSEGIDRDRAIELSLTIARVGELVIPGLSLSAALEVVIEQLQHREWAGAAPAAPVPTIPIPPALTAAVPSTPSEEPSLITHDILWDSVGRWLPPHSLLLAEAGTAFYGTLDLTLPTGTLLLGQPVWSSIGYTLPAAVGAALARPDLRPVLMIGDGSAQLTVQELGTLLSLPVAPVVLLLNNDGYTVERVIQSPDAPYQDIPTWQWTSLPAAFGAAGTEVSRVESPEELEVALRRAHDSEAAQFIEIPLDRLDAPRMLLEIARGLNHVNDTTPAPAAVSSR